MKVIINEISLKGKRDTNQDRLSIEKKKHELMIGVYDGHGTHGDIVSSYLQKHFIRDFKKLYQKNDIQEYIYNTQNKLKQKKEASESGSTLLVLKIDYIKKKIIVVNLGDCRALLGYANKFLQLTNDHKVDDISERLRLLESKKNVVYDNVDQLFRVDGYAVSRAMGNTKYDSISQKAEISFLEFSHNINYIIIACDGLWDVLDNKEVNDFILENKSNKNVAELLAKKAIDKGSEDNVSIIIVFFK